MELIGFDEAIEMSETLYAANGAPLAEEAKNFFLRGFAGNNLLYIQKSPQGQYVFSYGSSEKNILGTIRLDQDRVQSVIHDRKTQKEEIDITRLPNGQFYRKYEAQDELSATRTKRESDIRELDPKETGEYVLSSNEIIDREGTVVYQHAKQAVYGSYHHDCIASDEIVSTPDFVIHSDDMEDTIKAYSNASGQISQAQIHKLDEKKISSIDEQISKLRYPLEDAQALTAVTEAKKVSDMYMQIITSHEMSK